MKTKKSKLKKKTTETGAAQMAGPSGPQYDTTGNQRLENAYINFGSWENIITETVEKIVEQNERWNPSVPHGDYDIFISKKPASDTLNFGKDCPKGEYAAAARHREQRTVIQTSGKTPEEAKSNVIKKIDDFLKNLNRIRNHSTIDFNSAFSKMAKESKFQWAKIIPGPKLVIAGELMTEILNDAEAARTSKARTERYGFKKIKNRHAHTEAGDFYYPSFVVSPADAPDLIANGRYQIGTQESDEDGNLVFNVIFINVVRHGGEKFSIKGPGFNVATLRQKENPSVTEDSDLLELRYLSGINKNKEINNNGSNISLTANEKVKLMKEHDIKPGTPEWFRLWFSRPYMTGEEPL